MMPRQPIRILTPDERKGLSKTGLHAVTRPKEVELPLYVDTTAGSYTYTITFNDDENTMSMRPYTPSDDAIEH